MFIAGDFSRKRQLNFGRWQLKGNLGFIVINQFLG